MNKERVMNTKYRAPARKAMSVLGAREVLGTLGATVARRITNTLGALGAKATQKVMSARRMPNALGALGTRRVTSALGITVALMAALALPTLVVPTMTEAQQTAQIAQTAEEFIHKLEANQTHDTSILQGKIVIIDRFGERASEFISYNRGSNESLLEFTSPAERGQKVLRTADEIYLYYPDAAEIIRIQGAALRESLLGSDVSYEDLTGNRGYLDDYEAAILGTESIAGKPTTIIELTAISDDIAYPRQRLWVDNTDFVVLKSEQYALSGKLLKVSTTQELTTQRGKIFPTHITISDKLKRNSQTDFILETIDIDARLPQDIFSLEELSF